MLISVITPTLNSEKFLRECLDSVGKQKLKGFSFEQIVIDSSSSDNTKKISERYSHVRFIQAGEMTACEAINVGIGVARGEYLFFLMSDDIVLPLVFRDFLRALEEKAHVDMFIGSMEIIENKNGDFVVTRVKEGGALVSKHKIILYKILFGAPLLGATFIKRDLVNSLNGFDPKFPYSNDREFLVRATMHGVSVSTLDKVIIQFRVHENSTTSRPDGKFVCHYLKEHVFWAKQVHISRKKPFTMILMKIWRVHEMLRLLHYSLQRLVCFKQSS